MATIVLTTVGTMVGGPIGGAIGAVLGQLVDQQLFAPKARHGPRLGDLSVQTSAYGTALPKIFGTMRVAGTVIWSTDLIERRATSGGSKGRPGTVDYSYAASFAVALSGRPITEVRRIWADGKLLRGAAGDWKAKTGFRFHPGSDDQMPDPLIASAEGIGQTPAFRGIAYAMFEELELAEFGNRIPSLSFEVIADPGPVTIGAIAQELSGGTVVAGETPILTGFAADGDSVRGAIEDLAGIVPLPIADDGSQLVMALAPGPAKSVGMQEQSGRAMVERRPAATVPRDVSITYYDVARDYQTGLQRATAAGGAEARGEQRTLPAVLDAVAAKAIAERRLESLYVGRVSATVTLGWSRADLRAGTSIQLEGEGGAWTIRRATIGPMTVRLDLVRAVSGAVLASAGASPGRLLAQPDMPHGPTVARLLELPLLDRLADRAVVMVVAAGPQAGWRRAALSLSFDGGATWTDHGLTAAPAVMGIVTSMLPAAGSALIDEVGSVEIELLNDEMELLSRDDDALVAGANLALIGEELVQFGRAERMGERRYRLSRLLRGRRGTEWAADGHMVGEGFALMESAGIRIVDLPAGLTAGASVQLLASGIADEEPVEASLTLTTEAVKPPNPVHVTVEQVSGAMQIRWVRRSRQGWAWPSSADTPLGEERELYRLTFNGQRSIETASPAHLYSASEQAGDGPGPVAIEIVQLGTHAASRPTTITIP